MKALHYMTSKEIIEQAELLAGPREMCVDWCEVAEHKCPHCGSRNTQLKSSRKALPKKGPRFVRYEYILCERCNDCSWMEQYVATNVVEPDHVEAMPTKINDNTRR